MASGKKEDWWKQGGITREKINAMCWMKYEQGRKDLPIDKRADLVDDLRPADHERAPADQLARR